LFWNKNSVREALALACASLMAKSRMWARSVHAVVASLLLLLGLSFASAAQAQSLSVSVSPSSFSSAGQILHFTYTFNSGGYVISSLSIASALGISVSCPGPFTNNTGQTTTCTGSYTTTASDVGAQQVLEVAQFHLMAFATPVSGTQSGGSTVVPYAAAKSQSSTSVTSSVNPSVFNQSVTFTAHVAAVAPAAGTPTGSVTFYDGGSAVGTGALSGGTATFSTSALATGNHTITTSYGGDGSFNGSTGSLAGSQVVNKSVTTTTLSSSLNPSLPGQAVTFTATVSRQAPSSGAATGTVTFLDGGTPIGTGVLSGGVATLNTSALTSGSHTITASYGGDGNSNGSTGSLAGNPQVVNKGTTTTALSSSLNPSAPGQAITFTATIVAVAPAIGAPTGTVTFLDGGTPIGTGSVSGGTASFTSSSLAVGNHTVTASYAGDSSFNGSTGSLAGNPQVVKKGNVLASLTASQNPAGLGQSVTLTANISAIAPATGTPTGTVTFLDGGTPIGTGSLSGGAASFTTSSLTVGNHTITISYGGDATFNTATGSLPGNPLVVNKGAAAIVVKSSLPTSAVGQTVTFTATVSAVAPASGSPTGAVTFLDGGAPIGTGALSGGVATFSTAALAPGSHTITVSYAGDSNFGGAVAALGGSQAVNQGGVQMVVAANPSPGVAGQSVTLTATIAASGGAVGTPTGSITFTDGATTLGAVALSGGVATLVVPSFAAGAHTITAAFPGDANFVAATGSIVETVNKAGSSVALVVNGSATFGQAVTIRANVTPANATGTVTFFDNGAPIGSSAVGSGAASVTAAALAVGAHTITATYSGDANNTTASAPAATVTIGKASPAIALAASSATPLFGTAVTLTANVSGGQSPTGSIVFKDGANVLGTAALAGGAARISISSLSVGSHSIVAVYGGDANNASVSASTTVSVNARPDPTANGDVRGLIDAQVNMATRYGETQIGNTFRRLEQLHDEDDEEAAAQQLPSGLSPFQSPNGAVGFGGAGFGGGNPFGGGLASGAFGGVGGFGSSPTGVGRIGDPSTALAYAETVNVPQRPLQSDTALAVQSLSAALPSAFQALDKTGLMPFHVWATGAFSLGQIRSDGAIDNHFTSSGVTVGVDGKVLDRVKMGVAVGMGFDNTSVGTQGSASNATAYSATLYSSVKIARGSFLDFMAGYGALRFDNRRWSEDGGVMLDGVRNGHEAYGSVSFTQDFKWDGLKISPYARFDAVRVFLDGYRETGSDIWALSYDPLNDTTLSGVLGARVVYSIPMSWGILTPGGRVEYTHAFQGGYIQNLNYADLVAIAPGYSSTGVAMARDAVSLGLSLRAVTQGVTTWDLEYMVSTAGRQFEGQQLRASARQAF
jgi:hypothetical protein